MALIPFVYTNVGLTEQFDDAVDTVTVSAPNGSTGRGRFWVGTPNSGFKLQDQANPGVGDITVGIDDSSPGTGVLDTHIKLATSEGGLGGAVAGADLTLGTEIVHGSPVEVWVEWSNSVLTGADSTGEISFSLTALVEVAV